MAKNQTPKELIKERRNLIKKKLSFIQLPAEQGTSLCWSVGATIGITGITVKNYLNGNIGDGYIAESIFSEFEKLGHVKETAKK